MLNICKVFAHLKAFSDPLFHFICTTGKGLCLIQCNINATEEAINQCLLNEYKNSGKEEYIDGVDV